MRNKNNRNGRISQVAFVAILGLIGGVANAQTYQTKPGLKVVSSQSTVPPQGTRLDITSDNPKVSGFLVRPLLVMDGGKSTEMPFIYVPRYDANLGIPGTTSMVIPETNSEGKKVKVGFVYVMALVTDNTVVQVNGDNTVIQQVIPGQ